MKSMLPVFVVLPLLGCAAGTQNNGQTLESVVETDVTLDAKYSKNYLDITCSYDSSMSIDSWVRFCNLVAYEFIRGEEKKGVKFAERISLNTFGDAADTLLELSNSKVLGENVSISSLQRRFELLSEKAEEDSSKI